MPATVQAQARFLATVFYAAVTLVMVLCVWVYFGRSTDTLTLRAIASGVIAGGIIGFFSVSWLRNPSKKIAIVVGLVGGVLLHLLTWVFFAFWAWASVLISSNGPVGLLMDSLLAGVFWSVGSISFGAWFTSPALAATALLVQYRMNQASAQD